LSLLLYFAYGSNMSTRRIQRRVASATAVSTARLQEHALKFHKRSIDGSAKCDIAHTHERNDVVFGVVYELLVSDKPVLDKYEGLGIGYAEKSVAVIQPDGQSVEATAYYATHIDASLKPYHWYKQHVLIGALEHGLPREHVELIEATQSAPDPDQQKHIEELLIYPRI